ncbi:MAG TPA: transferase [Desulfobacteraceae bacterium]|nr:transferase [Deltaproteobacteria bacterium]HDI59160.1 transferase [Desulfobacteraceae bacterium]HDI59164.1 transferase [Desulfobacteraceae bacterium]
MKALKSLLDRIALRVNINLRELEFDVVPIARHLVPLKQMTKFYAFYGITPNHPLSLEFRHSSLAGSYFLGRCRTNHSILYKTDIRGDELQIKGDTFTFGGHSITLSEDEMIDVQDSFLVKTLVHSYSHDPESRERFFITNTLSCHYANIHGSPIDGSFLGPFATVDLTTMYDCAIGAYSYIQAGEIGHFQAEPGTVWARSRGDFNFVYKHPVERLKTYIHFVPGKAPSGVFMDFLEARKKDFERVFDVVNLQKPKGIPANASLDRYAVIKPKMHIAENVLVAQRAYLENSWLGKGANAQENCYILNSRLEGYNVTAHGAKIIDADLGRRVFVGFNSFLRGRPDCRLAIGSGSIVMPHTIIDIDQPMHIPEDHFVWGMITSAADLETNSMPLADFARIDGRLYRGNLLFEGSGEAFVTGFQKRIEHILLDNGALFDGKRYKGHAQRNQNISVNTIQPYPEGRLKGLYPTIIIQP